MGRPPRIDRQAVLEASLAVADEGGLDALTMAAVADRLGVTPMALYRHVANKADLLDGVVEQLLNEIDGTDDASPADDRLVAIGRSVRATARRHPHVFPLLLRLPATTAGARSTRDAVQAALAAVGVPDAEVARTERLIATMVLGFAASEAAGRFAAHSQAEIDGDYECLEGLIRDWIERRVTADDGI